MKNRYHILTLVMLSICTASTTLTRDNIPQGPEQSTNIWKEAAVPVAILGSLVGGTYIFSQSNAFQNGLNWAKKNPGKSLITGGVGAAAVGVLGAVGIVVALLDASIR